MQMSRKLFDTLGEYELDVRDDYSGRFMYGATCFAIDVDRVSTAVYDFINILQEMLEIEVDEELIEEVKEFLDYDWSSADIRTDNMGLGYVVYFPDITVDEEEENA